jgi:putative intracellular protease/amidase
MKKILCFVSNEMADFEVTLAIHLLHAVGKREILAVGNDPAPVVSQAGFTYLPDLAPGQAIDLEEVEALILPGGPIRPQGDWLTQLILKMNAEKKLLAAICFGPQHLGRAGVLDHHRFTTSCSEATIKSLQVPDPFPRHNYEEARVVRDGNIITSKGGAFVDFAFAITDYLDIFAGRNAERDRLYKEMMDR